MSTDMQTVIEKATHTPGPWEFDGVRVFAPACDEKVELVREDGSTVMHGRGLVALPYSCGDYTSHKANARLIAAAPDLLVALKNLRALIKGELSESVDCCLADSAIAKAEGC